MAAGVVYNPPDVAERVAEAKAGAQLSRNTSAIQRKGYASDEELDELDTPLISIVEKSQLSSTGNGNSKLANQRYKLLREVWSGGM